jgi:hypothetical protein
MRRKDIPKFLKKVKNKFKIRNSHRNNRIEVIYQPQEIKINKRTIFLFILMRQFNHRDLKGISQEVKNLPKYKFKISK